MSLQRLGAALRFDPSHPETNGMIEYFIRPPAGVRTAVGHGDGKAFQNDWETVAGSTKDIKIDSFVKGEYPH